jgi:hypothetical protein
MQWMLIGFIAVTLISEAKADLLVLCGEGRERGLGQAELALVDNAQGRKLYLRGKAVPDDDFSMKWRDNVMYAFIMLGKGNAQRRFTFPTSVRDHVVIEEWFDDNDRNTKTVAPKKCIWKESD